MTQQPTPQDQATLIYRIEVLERLFHELQQQLQQYVRASENNLHLQAIKETVLRIEQELQLAKKSAIRCQRKTDNERDRSSEAGCGTKGQPGQVADLDTSRYR